MKSLLFKIKSFFVMTFSKYFKDFENEYFNISSEILFKNGERYFSQKEKEYLKIIDTCINPQILYNGKKQSN
ncbi:hypothetical protein [Chryseobacterium sp. SL1]|uniref:hypothetical protein n=1 Tax=Chryseobacterium sp. SL1 TaxID=2995159 RepID=UPI002274E377|nr:hypothetical protein [Chryseobacterium sp. SL1]MCY1659323.1 hypothetical protein [Chryseobacterium sp. SL1]